ncbi:putative metalloreductase transmembrane component [Phaeomoniella chlamydospora]|uniref:ferric-chelate reductase (NADPH) n=1 Tax=Phaeomoniella chlamydospora TaxID=158046 RepID=A0A0G2GQ23_PHACM|nr:putative metalloreductase transmembrane component [Phaeomoniella chlamydospora]
MNPFRLSWLIGEESAVTILPENAVKVTIPTQKKWRPGQYVYLRMPGISLFENHPFTIASLCSDDFPSEYGPNYRDMTLVFRPFGGFTRKVYDTSLAKGPYKTYRAFIDGPYGGMQRELASFDHVIFFAGGSGITALASQLLDLIKRIRDGKAVTKQVHVIWALKRPETMEWFKEELRICREYAPPDAVHCSFYITASQRYSYGPDPATSRHSRPNSQVINDKIDNIFQGVASKRNSALMSDAISMQADHEKDIEHRADDQITALPSAHLSPPRPSYQASSHTSHSPSRNSFTAFGGGPFPPSSPVYPDHYHTQLQGQEPEQLSHFNFGFERPPTQFQKSLMRFAFLPTNARQDGWRTEYGRPDIPYMIKGFERTLARRTCFFVCGPPSMRVDVSNAVARMQTKVYINKGIEEIHLHAENYAI